MIFALLVCTVSFQAKSPVEIMLSKIAAFENSVVRIPAKLEFKQEATHHISRHSSLCQ